MSVAVSISRVSLGAGPGGARSAQGSAATSPRAATSPSSVNAQSSRPIGMVMNCSPSSS